jgi:hypothetical protein
MEESLLEERRRKVASQEEYRAQIAAQITLKSN